MMNEKEIAEAGQIMAIEMLIETFEKQFPNYEITFKKKELINKFSKNVNNVVDNSN